MTFPDSVILTKAQETAYFKEFAPVIHLVCAACCNIAGAKDFYKFAYLAKALDLLLGEAFKSMAGPEN